MKKLLNITIFLTAFAMPLAHGQTVAYQSTTIEACLKRAHHHDNVLSKDFLESCLQFTANKYIDPVAQNTCFVAFFSNANTLACLAKIIGKEYSDRGALLSCLRHPNPLDCLDDVPSTPKDL